MNKIEREKQVVRWMIDIYCRGRHHTDGGLCKECQELCDYALKRLDHCKFGEEKPTCKHCPIHCYKPEMRERIRDVMRYAGPRMVLYHPVAAIRHLMKS